MANSGIGFGANTPATSLAVTSNTRCRRWSDIAVRSITRLVQFSLLIALLFISNSALRAESELRVLIDVSGSMKQNDPDNLRQPALKLLIGLMPEGTRTAGWLFAEDTTVLLPPAIVDARWKQEAEKTVTKIHSRGQFTHIEQALKTALSDWEQGEDSEQRSIILLTDGMVDVSKQEADSLASRQRILEQLLPRLQQQKITVNAIALSENTDQELMRQLAIGTDGWHELATTAKDLQRMFLHMFEKSTDVETLPLQDNRFQVDNSIDEVTLLVFSEEGADETRLVMPDGTELKQSSAPDSINWRQEAGYDLITIPEPARGEWRILATVDPDNRVMVVTDLKMKVTSLPNHILAGEKIAYQMELLARDTRITRKDFLAFITATLEQKDSHGDLQTYPLQRGDDGVFTLQLQEQLIPGTYTLIAAVDSQTFQRRKSQSLQVHKSPMKTALVTSGDEVQPIHTITVSPLQELVAPDSISMQATLIGPDEAQQTVEFQKTEGGEHVLVLDTLKAGDYELLMNIQAQTPQGRSFVARPKPLKFESVSTLPATPASLGDATSATQPQSEAQQTEPEDTAESDEVPPEEAVTAEQEPETDWLFIGLAVAGVNLLLILLGGLGYLFWRKRQNVPGPEDEL